MCLKGWPLGVTYWEIWSFWRRCGFVGSSTLFVGVQTRYNHTILLTLKCWVPGIRCFIVLCGMLVKLSLYPFFPQNFFFIINNNFYLPHLQVIFISTFIIFFLAIIARLLLKQFNPFILSANEDLYNIWTRINLAFMISVASQNTSKLLHCRFLLDLCLDSIFLAFIFLLMDTFFSLWPIGLGISFRLLL